jgi:hypothetical protein
MLNGAGQCILERGYGSDSCSHPCAKGDYTTSRRRHRKLKKIHKKTSALLFAFDRFLGDLSGARPIRKRTWVLVRAYRFGMGCVPWGPGRLFLGLVFRAGSGVGHRVVPVILLLTFFVRAGLGLCSGFGVTGLAIRPESGSHRQGFVFPY